MRFPNRVETRIYCRVFTVTFSRYSFMTIISFQFNSFSSRFYLLSIHIDDEYNIIIVNIKYSFPGHVKWNIGEYTSEYVTKFFVVTLRDNRMVRPPHFLNWSKSSHKINYFVNNNFSWSDTNSKSILLQDLQLKIVN